MDPGKPGKSWNFILQFSRIGKSLKKTTGPRKISKFYVIRNVLDRKEN